jgi:hypothetical protein
LSCSALHCLLLLFCGCFGLSGSSSLCTCMPAAQTPRAWVRLNCSVECLQKRLAASLTSQRPLLCHKLQAQVSNVGSADGSATTADAATASKTF